MDATENHPHRDLILRAAELLRPHRMRDRLAGDVASIVVAESGREFGGVCIDTSCGTGFCAEHAAVAAMVTAGEYVIRTVVAVWKNADGVLHVLPPCGRCREFLRQLDDTNINTRVVLDTDHDESLRSLIPYWEWPDPAKI